MSLPPVLAVVADPVLADDLARLCAVTGLDLVVAPSPDGVTAAWASAPIVLVAADTPISTTAPIPSIPATPAIPAATRRTSVVVVRRDGDPDDARAWRTAALLGAGEVIGLPSDERRLVDRLADAAEGGASGGPLIAVASGCAGAGASTVAASLALALGRAMRDCLLIDGDPLGGGLDLLLEAEGTPGLRWPDLAATRGRVAVEALRAALPVVDGVAVVSVGRTAVPIGPEALTSMCDAGLRGFAATVVDLGAGVRAGPAIAVEEGAAAVLPRAQAVVVVVPATVRGAAAALAPARVLRAAHGRVHLVVRRGRGAEVTGEAIAEGLGLPLALEFAAERSGAGRLDGARSPGRRLLPLLAPRAVDAGRRIRRRIA